MLIMLSNPGQHGACVGVYDNLCDKRGASRSGLPCHGMHGCRIFCTCVRLYACVRVGEWVRGGTLIGANQILESYRWNDDHDTVMTLCSNSNPNYPTVPPCGRLHLFL